MWIDDDAAGFAESAQTDAPDQLAINVEGNEYGADVNFDLNHDGLLDTARIEHEDGSIAAYIDTDHDGQADKYLHVDSQGNPLESARFDAATNHWVSTEADQQSNAAIANAHTPSGLTADLDNGEVPVGTATVDTNNDGRADTSVVQGADGDTRLFTDVDGNNTSDVVTILDENGETTTYHHTADGEWVDDEGNHLPPSSDQAWGGRAGSSDGFAQIDSTTGQWI